MTSMDITALPVAPAQDTSCASADTHAGATGGFAALLDEAAASDEPEADDEEGFNEAAALAMPSLLSIDMQPPPAPEAVDGAEFLATDITGKAVVTDLTSRAELGDGKWSSTLPRSIGGDAGAGAKTAADQSIGDGASDTAGAESALRGMPQLPEAPMESTVVDSKAAWARSDGPSPMDKSDAAASMKTGDEAASMKPGAAAASMKATDAESYRRSKVSRGSSSSRRDVAKAEQLANIAASDAWQTVAEPAIGQAAEQSRGSERAQQVAAQQAPDSKASATAARFARALERAAALTTEIASRVASANGTSGDANGQGSGSGDSSSNHTLPSFAGRHGGPHALSFTVGAPSPIDAPTLAAAADAAGHAIDASLDIPERDVVAQLVHSLRMQFRDGIGEAVVKLRPEHLGSVQISIKVENGAMKATVQAEMPAVRQWLESNQDTLKNGLADHGLRLERFVVEPDGERAATSDDARQQQEQQRRRHQRRMSEKDRPVFEITV
jgi:flagellar hook-length control protein FliK